MTLIINEYLMVDIENIISGVRYVSLKGNTYMKLKFETFVTIITS